MLSKFLSFCTNGRDLKALLFDLDDTLYRSSELSTCVLEGIRAYMVNHLGYTRDSAIEEASKLYYNHGTTLAGLVDKGINIDFDHWHKEVHYGLIPYHDLLRPDPELRQILLALDPLPRYVFTNADQEHARICLEILGIADCFQGVYHFENLNRMALASGAVDSSRRSVVCKPSNKAYELIFEELGVKASEVLFFDDSLRNITAAHRLGVMTAMVGVSTRTPCADLFMPDLHALPGILRELDAASSREERGGEGLVGEGTSASLLENQEPEMVVVKA